MECQTTRKDTYSRNQRIIKLILEEDLSTGLSSKYEIKLRKPQASIDLNLPAPVEEHPEFRMNITERRKDKNQIQEILCFF
jgi:hypothetical protein